MRSDNYESFKAKRAADALAQMNNSRVHGHVRKYIGHYERLQKMLDAYNTRQASTEFRRKALLNQKKQNYQLEYDRIRGYIGNGHLIPSTTIAQLRKREAQLLALGAQAVNTIQD